MFSFVFELWLSIWQIELYDFKLMVVIIKSYCLYVEVFLESFLFLWEGFPRKAVKNVSNNMGIIIFGHSMLRSFKKLRLYVSSILFSGLDLFPLSDRTFASYWNMLCWQTKENNTLVMAVWIYLILFEVCVCGVVGTRKWNFNIFCLCVFVSSLGLIRNKNEWISELSEIYL